MWAAQYIPPRAQNGTGRKAIYRGGIWQTKYRYRNFRQVSKLTPTVIDHITSMHLIGYDKNRTASLKPSFPQHIVCVCVCVCVCSVAQSYQTLWDCMNHSPPVSPVHGIFPVRILEWAAISFSRGVFPTQRSNLLLHVSYLAGRFFTTEPPGKIHIFIEWSVLLKTVKDIRNLKVWNTFAARKESLRRHDN